VDDLTESQSETLAELVLSPPETAFALHNDPPPRKPWRAENDPTTQKTLLDGLDCLRGQQDLF
jgi:hypothetical protein